MALHCRLLFQIPSWNTFGTRSIRAFALEFQTGLPGYFHFSDETATQLQPPTRPGDARTAGNDGTRERGVVGVSAGRAPSRGSL